MVAFTAALKYRRTLLFWGLEAVVALGALLLPLSKGCQELGHSLKSLKCLAPALGGCEEYPLTWLLPSLP
jgi:hypothetical protein